MKKITSIVTKSVLVALSIAALSAPAMAQTPFFYDTAMVTNVQEIVQQQTSNNCSSNNVYNNGGSGSSNKGGIIGGIAGALLGSQVGQGNGKIAAAAVGGIVGALSGDQIDNRGNSQNYQSNNNGSNCYSQTNNQVIGYVVTYDYKGMRGQKRLSYNPGSTVRVSVTVEAQ